MYIYFLHYLHSFGHSGSPTQFTVPLQPHEYHAVRYFTFGTQYG